MERRLAAILAAHVAGYNRLMEAGEAGTLAALKHGEERLLRYCGARDDFCTATRSG
jgi:hypothetical protein